MVDRAFFWFLSLLSAALPISIVAAHISLGVLFVLAVYQFGVRRRPFVKTPLDRPVLIYLGVGLASALVSYRPTHSLMNLAALWHIAIYWLVVNGAGDAPRLRRVASLLFGLAVANGLYGIGQHVVGRLGLAGPPEIVRATGSFSHYMTFSGQMLLVSLLGAGLLLFWARGRDFKIAAGGTLVTILAAVASWTRNSWLGLGAGLLTVSFLKGRKALSFVAAGLAAGVIVLLLLYPEFRERAVSIGNVTTDESNRERLRTWKMSLEMISDHWLLGIGMGNYRSVMEQYRDRYGAVSHAHAHNTLLQITTETGLLGLSAYLYIWFIFFKEVFVTFRLSTDPMTRGLAAGSFGALVGFHVAGLFEYNFGDSEVAMMMWFMVGLGLAAGLRRSEAEA